MTKSVSIIDVIIIICKIITSCIVRRINVNHVDFALMRFFQKLQTCKIIALNQKVHLSAVANEQLFFFCQNRQIAFQCIINFFAMFLKNKPVFLTVDF